MVIREFDIICITSTGMVKKAVDGVEGDTCNGLEIKISHHEIHFWHRNVVNIAVLQYVSGNTCVGICSRYYVRGECVRENLCGENMCAGIDARECVRGEQETITLF